MDQQVNDFSLGSERALLIVTSKTCGPCKKYKIEQLPNTVALFSTTKIPLLHVDIADLSPHLQEEVTHTPIFYIYSLGERQGAADVQQNRSPHEMLRWVQGFVLAKAE